MNEAMKGFRRWQPALWASWKPFGIGEGRPNNYGEIARAIWENRDQLPFAWRILSQGVCDGCSLGTAGLRDWTIEGIHLCNVRLRLLRLNTTGELDPGILADVGPLRDLDGASLRRLGRLPAPMLRGKGEAGFRRVSWEQALELIAEQVRNSRPERTGYYLTSRGVGNETYYAAQKAVRAMGTNSIDNAARICHSPSTFGLKDTLGVAATTCSYRDWIGSDLIVFIGSNVANNQPVSMKYLYYAKKAGTKIAVVNPFREPGMERYWVPSNFESALFGTRFADRFFLISTGGDIAFCTGVLKHMLERNLVDRGFIDERTRGFPELENFLRAQNWTELEAGAGTSRQEMAELGEMLGRAQKAVFVWSMGVTQHVFGEDNVRSIVNLALTKGFVGREGCGLMPIRGHSGVQGGAEMGAYASAFPGGLPINPENARALSSQWGFEVPEERGLTAPEMVDSAHQSKLDVLFLVGGNFLEVFPDPEYVQEALERVRLRVHMDIVLSSQMLVDSSGAVLLLPAATRYETAGGITETTTERRVIFSPEIAGRRIAEARPEWEVFTALAKRVRPHLAEKIHFEGTAAIREEIAKTIPAYDGIQRLARQGDQCQLGGPHLCADWKFQTPDGKARFSLVALPRRALPSGSFVISTRRGKQFNSMVQERTDTLSGAERNDILISAEDADRLGLREGEAVLVSSSQGQMRGRIRRAEIKPGNLQAHWPEAEVLLDRTRRSPQSGIPDYNATVTVQKL
jgi:molybdopterin-dependent oxidoreductase alpha subunit